VASAALLCSSRFGSCFDRHSFYPASTGTTARQLSTVPSRDTGAASPASSEGTSVTPSVGIPPLTGFYAKYAVLVSAMGQGLYVPAVVALATSLLGAFYYLRFIRTF
jgi:hypothetical protein